MSKTPEEIAAEQAAKEKAAAEKAAAKAAKDAEKAAAKAAQAEATSATVEWLGNERTYSKEVHGENFAALARQFADQHADAVITLA